MPTYQYACTECGHQLEAVQSFSDEPLSECPVCQGRLRKLFNSVGIVFKGSGFYRTDSRGGSTSSEPSGTSSSESKPSETKKPAETQSSTKDSTSAKPATTSSGSSATSSSSAASTGS